MNMPVQKWKKTPKKRTKEKQYTKEKKKKE